MTSYSKVFKASQLSILDEVKIIKQPFIVKQAGQGWDPEETGQSLWEQANRDDQILEDAERKAQEIIAQAELTAKRLREETEEQIQSRLQENEVELEELSQQAKEQGYQEGFMLGQTEACEHIQNEYRDQLQQMAELMESAYHQKEEIIAEAEPFLLELSMAIAAQIVRQELDTHPDKFIELIKQHILRFKEKESITVCVHPDDFEFIQTQRSHLLAVVNGETEIKVIPDHSVTPKGCVIRTAYGSVDARIDTQLEEIKKVVIEAGREPESDPIS